MSTGPIVPATRGGELPPTPLTRADILPGAPQIRLGKLHRYIDGGARHRPFVGLLVPCKRCRRTHMFAWRGDWPASAEVVSFQTSHCPKDPRPVWLALDPETLDESAATLAEAQAAFREWLEALEREKVRRRAEREAGRLADATGPNSLSEPDPNPTPAT